MSRIGSTSTRLLPRLASKRKVCVWGESNEADATSEPRITGEGQYPLILFARINQALAQELVLPRDASVILLRSALREHLAQELALQSRKPHGKNSQTHLKQSL